MTTNSNYDPFFPTSKDGFNTWQPTMLTNFMDLFSAFGVNHVQMASIGQPSQTEQGKHTFVDMLQGTGDLETNQNQVNIYTELDGNKVSQLWMKFLSNTNHTQYTACENINYTQTITQSSLPGGFIVFSGTWPTNRANPVNIPVTSPGQGKPLCALVFSANTTDGIPSSSNGIISTTLQSNSVSVKFTKIGSINLVIPANIFYVILCEQAK